MRPQASSTNVVESVRSVTSGDVERVHLAGAAVDDDVEHALDRAGQVDRDARAVGKADLASDDVAERRFDFGDRHLGRRAVFVAREPERHPDVLFVHPEVEDPDVHEPPVGARADRGHARQVEIVVGHRGQLGASSGDHLAIPGEHLLVAERRHALHPFADLRRTAVCRASSPGGSPSSMCSTAPRCTSTPRTVQSGQSDCVAHCSADSWSNEVVERGPATPEGFDSRVTVHDSLRSAARSRSAAPTTSKPSSLKPTSTPRLMLTQSRASRYGRNVFGDPALDRLRLRLLQLVEVGELGPRGHRVPQPHRRISGRRVDQHRAEQAVIVEEQRRNTVPAGCNDTVVIGLDLVVGRFVGDRPIDDGRIEAELLRAGDGRPTVREAGCRLRGAPCPTIAYHRSTSSMLVRRSIAPIRISDQPNDHSRSHGCFLPSTRLISSRLKNLQLIVRPSWSRTSRIHFEVW